LVLTAFLGLNSLTGNESNTTITTTASQLSNDQDLPAALTPNVPVSEAVVDVVVNNTKSISVDEYADHMALSVAQLETVTLMLAVLDQTDGGPVPTE
jgi:hypothetical protein